MAKSEHWEELAVYAETLGITVDRRWSEITLERTIEDSQRGLQAEIMTTGEQPEMTDETAALEGEDLEMARQTLLSKLQAMGEAVHDDWDLATLQQKVTKKQQEQLMREAQSFGVSCDPSWSVEQLQEAIETARTPGDVPEGFDVVHVLCQEGEGEPVTCIREAGVHLGDGQRLEFKQKALVPADVAEALKGKDLCL